MKKQIEKKVDFNPVVARKTPKPEWIAQHQHHAEDTDLGEAWESLQEKKTPVKK